MKHKEALEYASFVVLSGLVKRLQEHSKATSNLDLACDLSMAADLIKNLVNTTTDDYK
jgi:hypothetical protein